MASVGLLSIILVVGGCGLMVGVGVLVVWAILDNARKNAPRDPQP